MAPLVLEGETLGQKHRDYNKLVNVAVSDQTTKITRLNYEDSDLENLVRIDVACNRRDVEYILDVLQCDDMLYVSRAIKQSKWLITDDQYAHIINPQHLHTELFPKMTSKAKTKLLLAIRLNLRNEARVEEFFNYYRHDIDVAQKWLPRCSLALIEKVYTEHSSHLTHDTYKRLCEVSINVVKIFIKKAPFYYHREQINVSKRLLKRYTEEYFDIVNNGSDYEVPMFGIRTTRYLSEHYPDKIMNNFKKYCHHIHLPTFAKYLKKEIIPDFLSKLAGDKNMEEWVRYDNIKHFVKYLPISNRFEFVKRLFIDKEISSLNTEIAPTGTMLHCRVVATPKVAMCNADFAYQGAVTSNASKSIPTVWYRFASFDTAFVDLKKLIRVESSPAERNTILTVLINCATRSNMQQVHTLLKYYREKHLNEPFKFKVQFVNTFLSSVDTHKFDKNTWAILHDIFSSMEVYIESENSVPYCVKAVIVYKLLHNEDIPEMIQKKHVFDTFGDYRKKLDTTEQNIIFEYLYNIEIKKIQTKINENEKTAAFKLLNNVLNLLKEWDRKVSDYPAVLEKIQFFIKMKNEDISKNLLKMYNDKKKLRRLLFEESLVLDPNDKTCFNALKHDPSLFERYSAEVTAMCSNDTISLKKTLNKLRIYWAQTLAQKWAEAYLQRLEEPTSHKATVHGIFILLPRSRVLGLLGKYAPIETKIDWSNADIAKLSLQKNISKRMKLIRPAIHLDVVLAYAKDDYLQFAMPSLNAVMYNMPAAQVSEFIPRLFDSPVSLQKHGLRVAYSKLQFSKIKDLVENIWKNTKNSSIKTVLFEESFELLRKEKKDNAIKDLWELLGTFIENLTPDENKVIYYTLGLAANVPMIVRPQFFMKIYSYLKSLPANAICESVIRVLNQFAPQIIGKLEPSFVETVLLKNIPEFMEFMTGKTDSYRYDITAILASYILSSENEEKVFSRHEKYLVPILNGCFKSWKHIREGKFVVKINCFELLNILIEDVKKCTPQKFVVLAKMFKDIETRLRTALPIEQEYRILTFWSIGVLFVESVINYTKVSPLLTEESSDIDTIKGSGTDKLCDQKWEEFCNAVASMFGRACLDFLKRDIASQYTSLGNLFVTSLLDIFKYMNFKDYTRALILRHLLDKNVNVSYLIVLDGVKALYNLRKDEKASSVVREIYLLIESHSATEVKVHFYEMMYSNAPDIDEAIPYRDADEA